MNNPDFDALKSNVQSLRNALKVAERELADAYGPRIAPLVNFLLRRFGDGELRRLIRGIVGSDRANELPALCSPRDLANAGAIVCYEAKISKDHLFSTFLRERPNCIADINAALKDWGAA